MGIHLLDFSYNYCFAIFFMKKRFVKIFLPDYEFVKVTKISQDFFAGAELLIFDIDNTLFFSETTEIEKEIFDWFRQIIKKYNCLAVSNSSTIVKRNQKISELLGCEVFLSRHKKPSNALFQEIKKKYNFENNKVFLVGDRVFTDILFGNLNGIKTVLVKPLGKNEDIFIKIIRVIEALALFLARFSV